jgi:hypothetical protein
MGAEFIQEQTHTALGKEIVLTISFLVAAARPIPADWRMQMKRDPSESRGLLPQFIECAQEFLVHRSPLFFVLVVRAAHAVLDVVFDDEIKFLGREPVVLRQDYLDLVDNGLGETRD